MAESMQQPGMCDRRCTLDEYNEGSKEMLALAGLEPDVRRANMLKSIGSYHKAIVDNATEVAGGYPCTLSRENNDEATAIGSAVEAVVGIPGITCPLAMTAIGRVDMSEIDV
jgi:hypothetical protein